MLRPAKPSVEGGRAAAHFAADEPAELDGELREAYLDDAGRCLAAMEQAAMAAEAEPRNPQPVRQICRELHTLKGASASVGLSDVAGYLHEVEERLQMACEGPAATTDVQLILETVDAVRRRVAALTGPRKTAAASDVPAAAVSASPGPSPETLDDTLAARDETARIKVSQLDRLLDMLAQLVMLRNRRDSRVAQLKQINAELISCVSRLRLVHDGCGSSTAGLSPSTSPLTELASDALEIARSLRGLYEPLAEENLAVSHFIRQFRQELVALGRLPVGGLFRRLQRAVRDAARSEGKQVRVQTGGDDVGLERAVQERLYEPLLHIVRNAVSHGIETESQRRAAGKEAAGTVWLAAQSSANLLVIEVRDDGQGLDYEAIRRRGLERGLLAPNRPATLAELAQLIFQPGFSTRSQAGAVAGRGVGMDVVAAALERLRGWVEVESNPGQGTCVRLSIPLRSVIEHTMVFRAAGQMFGIPLSCVHRAGDWDAESRRPQRTTAGQIAAIPLAELLSLTTADAGRPSQVLVLEQVPAASAGRGRETSVHGGPGGPLRLAILVDQIVGPEEVVVRPLPPLLRTQRCCSGVTLSGSGEIMLLLDGHQLVERAARRRDFPPGPRDVASHGTRPHEEATTVLVVDDSLSARRSLSQLLAHQGCLVVEAPDGLQALETLRGRRINAVFSDLEMPRLDGFELLHEIRSNPDTCRLPVVLVSSRSEPEFPARARELGATTYLTKPLREPVLLQTLGQLALPGCAAILGRTP